MTVGKALDLAHKPWLGGLLLVSKGLCILSVAAAIVYSLVAGPLSGPITDLWPTKDPDAWDGDYTRIREFYWSGEEDSWWKSVVLTATGQGTASVERAGYMITVPYAEAWELTIQGGGIERFYFMALTV